MKRTIIVLILVSLLFQLNLKSTNAWFGAGKTPGLPPTSTGLNGEIPLPSYKFAPDFYTIGDMVNISVKAFNTTGNTVVSNYYLVIHKVLESPLGSDVANGTPSTPGLNENDLFLNYKNGNDTESTTQWINLGVKTFLPNLYTTFSGNYLTNQEGYFKFDFVDTDSSNYASENTLATGFFRVLSNSKTNTPTSSTATPEPTPIACSGDTHPDAAGKNCVAYQFGGPQQSSGNSVPKVLGASTQAGQVLGAATMAQTGTYEENFYILLMIIGGIVSYFGIKMANLLK